MALVKGLQRQVVSSCSPFATCQRCVGCDADSNRTESKSMNVQLVLLYDVPLNVVMHQNLDNSPQRTVSFLFKFWLNHFVVGPQMGACS